MNFCLELKIQVGHTWISPLFHKARTAGGTVPLHGDSETRSHGRDGRTSCTQAFAGCFTTAKLMDRATLQPRWSSQRRIHPQGQTPVTALNPGPPRAACSAKPLTPMAQSLNPSLSEMPPRPFSPSCFVAVLWKQLRLPLSPLTCSPTTH